MKKIAVLIECHKNPDQINMMLDTMKDPSLTFFIHIDKKADIKECIMRRNDIIILPDEYRINVLWGKTSQVDASLSLFRYARQHGDYDFFWLCSGQDFPIKPIKEIVNWFEIHPDNDFVELTASYNTGLNRENSFDKRSTIYYPQCFFGNKLWQRIIKRAYVELTGGYKHTFGWARRKPLSGIKFYYGSAWVCLTIRTIDWMLDYLEDHDEFYNYMQNCSIPDESFYQTLLMNSPFADKRMDYLHYIDWSEGKNSPKILKSEDMEKLLKSDKLMARKFDASTDQIVLDDLRSLCLSKQSNYPFKKD